jgi:uncharacterized protein (UPF0212 family)
MNEIYAVLRRWNFDWAIDAGKLEISRQIENMEVFYVAILVGRQECMNCGRNSIC